MFAFPNSRALITLLQPLFFQAHCLHIFQDCVASLSRHSKNFAGEARTGGRQRETTSTIISRVQMTVIAKYALNNVNDAQSSPLGSVAFGRGGCKAFSAINRINPCIEDKKKPLLLNWYKERKFDVYAGKSCKRNQRYEKSTDSHPRTIRG